MKFYYLIAAYNEVEILPQLVSTLADVVNRFPGSRAFIVDNASTDGSQQLLSQLQLQNSWLTAIFEREKGMGVAFRRGLEHIQELPLGKEDWIAFNAADLPFGFSDLDAFIETHKRYPESFLFIGSKSHPLSKVPRDLKRRLASFVFRMIRMIFLKMKTKDPQGTLFLRGDRAQIAGKVLAQDYFFTTELVYHVEKEAPVIEMPVVLQMESRPSKVRLWSDGTKALKQVYGLRGRR